MKTKMCLGITAMCLFVIASINGQASTKEFDAIVSEYYSNDMPGATILVAKNGKAIYRKAVGKSNLEQDVDMIPENIFLLASITKQFTAVAILMLEEQGKLSLDDPITKFIEDYPTQGKTISIHHLLNHTSGIKSYTGIGNLIELSRQEKTVDELIDYFKNEPMDFEPGEAYAYNNSGYALLGKVIEVVSGKTYEDFIENQIFKPLEMENSSFDNSRELVKNRVSRYEQEEEGYVNAHYFSPTIGYSAGSLSSNIDDMLKWQNALSNNVLIKSTTFQKAINGSELNNGEHIDYGYGLSEIIFKGSKGYTHSGGIFGISTDGIYFIEEDVYIIGLSNCNCNNINGLTAKLGALAIGKPYPSMSDVVTLSEAQLNKWVGAYEFEDGAVRHIYLDDGKLKSMRESETNTAFDIFPLSENRFMFENGFIEYKFAMTNDGKPKVVFSTESKDYSGKLIDKERPEARKEITLTNDILLPYVGVYELEPGFNVEITVSGNKIFAQATGQGKFELFAESETSFFAKVTALKVVFNKNAEGLVESFTLHQGGEMLAKKIE